MGNRSSNNSNQKIGSEAKCPNCDRKFGPSTTYNLLNTHIDQCLQNQQQVNNLGFQMPQPQVQFGDNYIWVKQNNQWKRIQSQVNGGQIQNLSVQDIKNRSFPEKQMWFNLQLEKFRIPWQLGSDKLNVNYNDLLQSSLISARNVNLYKEVKVVFQNDKVQDAGGLLREWLTLIFKEMCKDIFTLTETNDVTYKIAKQSQYFDLVGLAIAKALFERMTICVEFDRPLVKKLLGQEIEFQDMQFYDKSLFMSWKYLLENQFDENELQQYFIICKDDEIIELKQNGADILVNNQNKQEFVDLCIQFYSEKMISKQLGQIQTALYKYIPKDYLNIFTADEFEMILYGVSVVDLAEWKQHTTYKTPYADTSQQIQWFWKILSEFDQDQLKKFLHYCTGSYRIPVNGFSKLESNRGMYSKFQIVPIDYKNSNSFPIAHTCFNRLELPKYTSEEMMRKYLRSIVLNDLEGVFGME
ncbi:unnamed protein product [Paramecium octaurelia]|uniref:HECT domain-containing protein n=1 Tax=Paramecium octaurelia TaxID=43137 RepID=A0A8S1TZW3_PAROT|nr:unnamed protein product [Paramecium octaurelia]